MRLACLVMRTIWIQITLNNRASNRLSLRHLLIFLLPLWNQIHLFVPQILLRWIYRHSKDQRRVFLYFADFVLTLLAQNFNTGQGSLSPFEIVRAATEANQLATQRLNTLMAEQAVISN